MNQLFHQRRLPLPTLLLLALLIAGAALRLVDLNAGLWFDEILTFENYGQLSFREIVTTYDSENQHFLYSLLARAAFLMFGESPWALRLPAALFGVGSILALYLLGRQVAGEREGLMAAALLTFSYHHVWFSQNARGYSGLLFWTLLSSLFFLRGLAKARPLDWFLFGLSAALGVYTHMTMVFVILGQFVTGLLALLLSRGSSATTAWSGRPEPLRLRSLQQILSDAPPVLMGFGLSALLTILLHAPVIPQILGTIGGSEVSVVTAWKSPLWTLLEIARGLRVGFAGGMVGAAALFLFGAGMFSYARTYPPLLGLLVFPPLIGGAAVIAIGHHLWPRFFFFTMGFGALVTIRGLMVLGSLLARWVPPFQRNPTWAGTALAAGLIALSALSVPFAYGPKQDYEGALRFIESSRQPGDAVIAVGLAGYAYRNYYETGWPEIDSLETLQAVRSASPRTWLLYTFPPVVESVYPEIMASIRRDFTPIQEFRGTVNGGAIIVVRSDSRPSAQK